jgi:hypothetical protein
MIGRRATVFSKNAKSEGCPEPIGEGAIDDADLKRCLREVDGGSRLGEALSRIRFFLACHLHIVKNCLPKQ